MAYEKTIWINGVTPVNADKLNKIENTLEYLDKNKTSFDGDYDNLRNLPNLSIYAKESYVNEKLKNGKTFFNIKDFGAKGDGVTDDISYIQSLLDLARAKNGINIYFPPGTYLISYPFQVFDNTYLLLDDGATIKRKLSGDMLINGYVGGDIQCSNITIEGGTWDCDNNHTNYNGCVHFTIGNAENITIKNITFLNNHGNHALDLAGLKNVYIGNCRFLGQWVNPNDVRNMVEAIQISEFTAEGQSIFGGGHNKKACENIIIENCIFDKNVNNSKYEGYCCAIGHHSAEDNFRNKNILIKNCIINNCKTYGIRPFAWQGITIDNCTFNNCVEGIHLTNVDKGSMSYDNVYQLLCSNITIKNCDFYNTEKNAIWCVGKCTDVSQIGYASNIKINNCNFYHDTIGNLDAIYIELSNDISINKCKFENQHRAIFIKSCTNLNVDENIGMNIRNEFFYSNASIFDALVKNKNITVSNNKIDTTQKTGIFLIETNYFYIKDNILLNTCKETINTRNAISIASNCITGFISQNISNKSSCKYGLEITNTCSDILQINNKVCGNISDINDAGV